MKFLCKTAKEYHKFFNVLMVTPIYRDGYYGVIVITRDNNLKLEFDNGIIGTLIVKDKKDNVVEEIINIQTWEVSV